MAGKTTYSIAKLQANDVERVTKRSNVLANRIWRMSVDSARSNKVHGATTIRVHDFDEELQQKAYEELLDLMVYAYLMRLRLGTRRRRKTKKVGLRLASQVHIDARRFADRFQLDIDKIKQRFAPIARKAMAMTEKDIRDVMNSALEDATREGAPTYEATEDVIDAIRKHGIEPKSTAYIESLVRTHASIAYNAAHKISFEGDTDVWGFEYVTVGDNRVRPEHEILDGTMRKKDDPFWETFWPPNGWNCRCQTVAIYDEDARQTPVPEDAEPDEGFDFDPAELVR